MNKKHSKRKEHGHGCMLIISNFEVKNKNRKNHLLHMNCETKINQLNVNWPLYYRLSYLGYGFTNQVSILSKLIFHWNGISVSLRGSLSILFIFIHTHNTNVIHMFIMYFLHQFRVFMLIITR
jgi:hypothetical protein